jgi:hypothetical protein
MPARRALLCALLASICAAAGAAQTDVVEVLARGRVFAEFGPGITAFKRDPAGRYYVLVARAGGVAVLDAGGKRLAQIPPNPATGEAPAGGPAPSAPAAITYGADFDLDAQGRVYIADPGTNVVKVFSHEGTLLRAVAAPSPSAVAVLPEEEIAVTSGALAAGEANPRLVSVYNAKGRLTRQFGDAIQIALRPDVNHLLGAGRLLSDGKGFVFYAYTYLPEPTLRKYDRFGYVTLEVELATPEFAPAAQATRREIQKMDARRSGRPLLNPTVNAVGVDPVTDEIWLALSNVVLLMDKEGVVRRAFRLFTQDGARLEPVAIVVENDRLLVAADPLGIYEFRRPDKPLR